MHPQCIFQLDLQFSCLPSSLKLHSKLKFSPVKPMVALVARGNSCSLQNKVLTCTMVHLVNTLHQLSQSALYGATDHIFTIMITLTVLGLTNLSKKEKKKRIQIKNFILYDTCYTRAANCYFILQTTAEFQLNNYNQYIYQESMMMQYKIH